MDKQHILDEIKRTALLNDGKPLGRERFAKETGIHESDWLGRHWLRWGDAVKEAGFPPNKMRSAYDDIQLIEKLVSWIRELGHFPVSAEFRMKARSDLGFPWHNSFARLGSKQQLVEKIQKYCENHPGNEDVAEVCAAVGDDEDDRNASSNQEDADVGLKEGHVYLTLLKVGREKRYKIGNTVDVERRTNQLSAKLPEEPEIIHTISTDDALGIEAYWHKRFAAKRRNGEWFSLSPYDIRVFKRRKFM